MAVPDVCWDEILPLTVYHKKIISFIQFPVMPFIVWMKK